MNNIDTKHPVLKNFDTTKSTVASPEQKILDNELKNANEKNENKKKKEEKEKTNQHAKKAEETQNANEKAKEIVRDPMKLLKAF